MLEGHHYDPTGCCKGSVLNIEMSSLVLILGAAMVFQVGASQTGCRITGCTVVLMNVKLGTVLVGRR